MAEFRFSGAISFLFLTFLLLASCQRNLVRDVSDDGPRVNGVSVRILDSLLQSVSRPLGGTASACVVRLSDGQVMWEYDSWRRMLPASTQKVAVAAVVRNLLGPDARLTTSWFRQGVVVDSILQGNLHLVGGADPSFGLYADTAWFDTVAARISATGIDTVSGNLVIRDPFLASQDFAWPGSWDFDNSYSSCSGAPSTGWSFNGNCPHDTAFLDPLRQIGLMQMAALARRHVTVLGQMQIERGVGADSTDTLLFMKESPPLDSLLRHALTRSSNHAMETFGLVLGRGDSLSVRENGMRRVRLALHGAGLDTTRNHLQDMSGMSRKNYVTARDMASVLRGLFADTTNHLTDLLPGPGEGTLSTRFTQGLPQGTLLKAKTGSLDGVSGLVGLLRPAQGEALVFVLFFNSYTGGSAPVRAMQDRMVELLAGADRQAP